VRLRDRVDDRKTQTDTTLCARPRGVCSREAFEDPRESIVRDADARVAHLDDYLAAESARGQLDLVAGLAVLDSVLEQGVERDPQLLGVRADGADGEVPQEPAPWRDFRPAHEDVLEKGVELDLVVLEEVGLIGPGK
jgi:hypothetical protein